MALCANCGEDNPDRARFCLGCGSPLAAAAPPPPPTEERKVITALFTDIVGSTASAEELDPEDVRARLAPYYARLRSELERHGGTVEKFIGDAVVAIFGAPVAHEDDPERAVRAALAINDAIDDLNAQDAWLDLKIRTAVHTGEALVVFGMAAGEGEGMAAGDVMNTAARLQGAAPINGIVVGEQTYAATRHAIDYRRGEPVQAKGKSEPIPVWEVLGTKEADPDAVTRAPLTGRAEERERLRRLWEGVRRDGRRAVATVVGNPGVGKTRLLRDFTEHARSDGRVVCGRCLSYGEGITYWPVIEVVKEAAGILQSDGEKSVAGKLGELLDGLPTDDQDELRTMAAALSNLVGVRCTPRGTYTASEITQAELHWGIRRVLELLASEHPLVVMLEDLHWAEPTLLELIRFIVDGGTAVPLFVLASARPELLDADSFVLAADGNRHVLTLDALTRADSEAMLLGLTQGTPLPPVLVETVLERAGGNPLFLEELVQMLADAQLLDGADHTRALESIPVPQSLQALIGSRLDRLRADAKHAAQRASVVGTVFWSGALADLAETTDVDPILDELARRDFVYPRADSSVAGEREFAFKHVLIRDVAYGRLPKGRRAALHLRFADWVNGLPGTQDDFLEIVAHHLEQACLLAREVARAPIEPPTLRAVEALKLSAERAERREGIREAQRFYERALEIAGDDPELTVELRLGRTRLLTTLGDVRTAQAELLDVIDAALAVERRDVRAGALTTLANIDWKQGRIADARARLAEARELMTAADDRCGVTRAVFEEALAAWFGGAADEAVELLRDGVAMADALDDRALRVDGRLRLGSLYFNLGRLAEAEEQYERARSLAREEASHRDEARAVSLLAGARYFRGPLAEAEALALQALEWLERTGDSYLQIQTLRALAKYALGRGQPDVAEDRLRKALPLALEAGGWVVVEIYRYLIEALLCQHRHPDARELAEFATRNAGEAGPYAESAALLARGLVSAADRDVEAAAPDFDEAFRLLDEHDYGTDLADARITVARALRRAGDVAGALRELERARDTLTRVGATGLLDSVETDIGDLTEQAARGEPVVSPTR